VSLLEVERRVSHRAEDLFDLVGDVRRYPEFIPWIKSMRLTDVREDGAKTSFLAEALVGFKMVRERFVTRVARNSDALSIDVDLHSGPFRRLQNRWRFVPEDKSTLVKFAIDFEFSSALLQAILVTNKERAARIIMDAFLREADRRYGANHR
jgi:coenzyme Q-binding protein COQ10